MKLVEAFNSAYKTIRINDDMYAFDTDAGNSYQVYFDVYEDVATDMVEMEIIFNLIDVLTGTPMRKYEAEIEMKKDNPMKILSTVFAVVKKHIHRYQPDIVHFSGKKQLGQVYERMIPRLFNQISGYEFVKTIQLDGGKAFVFEKTPKW